MLSSTHVDQSASIQDKVRQLNQTLKQIAQEVSQQQANRSRTNDVVRASTGKAHGMAPAGSSAASTSVQGGSQNTTNGETAPAPEVVNKLRGSTARPSASGPTRSQQQGGGDAMRAATQQLEALMARLQRAKEQGGLQQKPKCCNLLMQLPPVA
jgi:hypothetical protein